MIHSSQGIILKVFPYSNTSLICNVFTKEHGKLTFIAKGIRKPKNPLLSILQPFNLLEFQYYYKKNRSMQLIKEADILISFLQLRDHWSTIIIANTILNMINKIFEEEYSNETIFRLIYRILSKLSSNDHLNKSFYIFFLFHLSKQLGFMPNFERCYSCNNLFKHDAIFSLSSHSLICSNCNIHNVLDTDIIISYSGLSMLKLINVTHINQIAELNISSPCLIELHKFLISFMRSNINYMNNLKGYDKIDKLYYE